MRRTLWTAAVLVMGLAWTASAGAAQDRLWSAGNSRAAWLIRQNGGAGVYDVAAKPVGGAWKWVCNGLRGTPAAIVALDGQLQVLLTGGDCLALDLETGRPQAGLSPNDPRWPRGASVVGACAGGRPDDGKPSSTAIVFVRTTAAAIGAAPASTSASAPVAPTSRPAATATAASRRAASRPAPAARETLAMFHQAGGRWTYMDEVPGVFAPGEQVLAAAMGEQLFVLLHGKSGSRMYVRTGPGQWSGPLTLQKQAPDAQKLVPDGQKPLALVGLKDSLVLVRLADGDRRRSVSLAVIEKDMNWTSQPVALEAIGAGVQATAYADGVAMVWPAAPAPRFVACDTGGAVKVDETVALLGAAAADTGAERAWEYFLYVLFGLFAVGVLSRMRSPRVPLLLPDRFRPAPVSRRLIACLIDMVPFGIIAFTLFPFNVESPASQQEAMEYLRRASKDLNAALWIISTFSMHALYTCVMEARLGTTLGKRLMNLWVVGPGGRKPLPQETLYRAVLRILEIGTIFGWAVGIAAMVFTRYRQRVGDLLSQTAVIEIAPTASAPPAPDDTPPAPPQ